MPSNPGKSLPHHSLLVVCDGGRALLMRNIGSADAPKLQTVDAMRHRAPPTRELGSDRPVRVHASHGTARSAVSETDYHHAEESEFLQSVCSRIERAMADQAEAPRLVIAAPPRVIGELRSLLPPPIRAVVTVEIGKDLTKLSIDEIETYFRM